MIVLYTFKNINKSLRKESILIFNCEQSLNKNFCLHLNVINGFKLTTTRFVLKNNYYNTTNFGYETLFKRARMKKL